MMSEPRQGTRRSSPIRAPGPLAGALSSLTHVSLRPRQPSQVTPGVPGGAGGGGGGGNVEKWSWVPVANTLDKNPGQLPAPALPTRCHQGAQSLPPVRAQEGKAGGPFQEGSGVPHALWLSLQHLSAARGSSGGGGIYGRCPAQRRAGDTRLAHLPCLGVKPQGHYPVYRASCPPPIPPGPCPMAHRWHLPGRSPTPPLCWGLGHLPGSPGSCLHKRV